MLRYLTGEDNTKRAVNENYGRELMELFTLGVTDAAGNPNYTEVDVREAARSASGWQIQDDDPDAVKAVFTRTRWDDGAEDGAREDGRVRPPPARGRGARAPQPRAVPRHASCGTSSSPPTPTRRRCATWCGSTRGRGSG